MICHCNAILMTKSYQKYKYDFKKVTMYDQKYLPYIRGTKSLQWSELFSEILFIAGIYAYYKIFSASNGSIYLGGTRPYVLALGCNRRLG